MSAPYDYSIHHGFANSAALDAAGVDELTEDPPGGRFIRREGGQQPTGELVERATWPVQRAIPPYPAEVHMDAVEWAVHMANRFGITSVQEASAGPATLQALRALDEAGKLTARVAAHLVWKEEGFGGASERDLYALLDRFEDFESAHVRSSFVKLWLDGAPLPPHSSAVWLDADGNVDRSWLLISEEELHPALARFDREGRTVKIHCAGDGSVRVALDAIEAVRQVNGPNGPIHEVAHCAFVSPADITRFSELNVVAEMSPALWHSKEPEHKILDAGFKFRTAIEAGALVTIGSDWIITPDPNLFPALQGVLDRGDESLSLERALRVMTIDGATAVRGAAVTGSLVPGKAADVIVLDRDLSAVPVTDVGETAVLLTLFEGRPVHRQLYTN